MPANRLPKTVSVLKPSICFIIKIMIAQSNHVRLGGKPACAQIPNRSPRWAEQPSVGLRSTIEHLNTFRNYVQNRRANQIQVTFLRFDDARRHCIVCELEQTTDHSTSSVTVPSLHSCETQYRGRERRLDGMRGNTGMANLGPRGWECLSEQG